MAPLLRRRRSRAHALKYATSEWIPAARLLVHAAIHACDGQALQDKRSSSTVPDDVHHEPEKEIISPWSPREQLQMCLPRYGHGQTLSPEDCKLIVDGGLPTQSERARTIAIAAKYAVCHKGILLEREASHLESMGVSKEMYGEILFLAGQITANNMFFVYLIQQGVAVEEPLQAAGPFATTVYAKKE